MFRLPGFALSFCLLAIPVQAEPVTSLTLANGLEVVVIEDHRAPVVVHMIWYHAGAADEPPGKSGIAHFLEHLMFKGTDTRAPGEFSAIVEAQGGRDNAFTSWDYTGYFQRIAADRLELVMELEADRMQNLSFTEAEWLPERDVILEERGQVIESQPGAVFREQLRAAKFLSHPYRIPIIGWRHEMEGLTDQDAMDFHAHHYAPNNAVLIVAGAVSADEVRELAERHYGGIDVSPGIVPRQRPQEPPHLAERRVIYEDPRVGQPIVSRLYLAPARRSGAQEEAAALEVLAYLLGGSSTTSVLARRLVFDEGIAIGASAFHSGVALDDGVFTITIAPADGVALEDAEAALDRVIAEFLEQGVDPAQFERVQTQVRASEIYALDNVQSRARNYGIALTSGLTVADVDDWLAQLQRVTPDDVMAAAEALFDRRRSVTGWMMAPADMEGAE